MEIGSFFLLLALLIPVSLFIARPLLDRQAVVVTPEEDMQEHEYSALLAERDRILTALEELDFDNALGKIPQGDYQPTRDRLLLQGAEVLRQLDAIDPEKADAEIEQRIENAIEERRLAAAQADQRSQVMVVDADDEVELQLAARRRAREGKSAGFCPRCGRPVQVADRFCPKCGYALA
ncbi:MAG: zinc ribbon domain-containing protein [Anaerolineales bacterium]